MKKKYATTLSLSLEAWTLIARYCERNGIGRSAAVQQIIIKYLKENQY